MSTRHQDSDDGSDAESNSSASGSSGTSTPNGSNRGQDEFHTTPDGVKDFISDFALSVREKKLPDILHLYSVQFPKLTDRYYKQGEWPSLQYSYAKDTLSQPHVQALYEELICRHMLTKPSPSTEQYIDAWSTYSELLQLLLEDLANPAIPGKIILPATWYWDILDEFVYHYQKYVASRSKEVGGAKPSAAGELMLKSSAWDTKQLMALLEELVSKSRINMYLQRVREGQPKDGSDKPCESAQLIGYFSLVQLCRIHSLHGDYHRALQTIDMFDFKATVPLYCTAPSCHVSLFYHIGFAYMMMKRYYDATQTFSHILLYLAKSRATAQYQDRMQEKCSTLLLICVTLCPGSMDDMVSKLLAEKYSDFHSKMQASLASREDDKMQVFQDKFSFACPKFIPPVEETESTSCTEAQARQLSVFMSEVRQMKMLPTLMSFMKLYTTIPLTKLARFCEMDVDNLKQQMLGLKLKTKQLVHPADSHKGPLYGEEMNCADIEFHVDDEKVHVHYLKQEVSYTQMFLKCIAQVEEIKKTLTDDLF